jgi:protein SCO1
MMVRRFWSCVSSVIVLGVLFGCESKVTEDLPVLGPYKVQDNVVDGKFVTDTSFSQIRPFIFLNQDGHEITEKTVDGKIYVTDFFFTSCPTICPKMKQQLLRVYDEFEGEQDLLILSHSIDPKRDSVGRLNDFAKKLGIESARWHLLTGNQDTIFSMARHYMSVAQVDKLAPGGFAHSGSFLLVDRNRQIRGIYDGKNPDEVDKLMDDLHYVLSHPTPMQ